MHLSKHTFKRHLMKHQQILNWANAIMLMSLIILIANIVLAYGFEAHFELLTLSVLHVSPLFIAGVLKLTYVVRLVAQKQLGVSVR